jgi:hypothetical protein
MPMVTSRFPTSASPLFPSISKTAFSTLPAARRRTQHRRFSVGVVVTTDLKPMRGHVASYSTYFSPVTFLSAIQIFR